MDEMTSCEHIASISYGKDSLAMLEAIKLLNYPLDRIVTAEIWATDTIQADVPPMVEFKAKADEIILERYGIKVEHFTATKYYGIEKDKVTYADCFYNTRKKGKHIGVIYGFPMVKGNWCTGLKLAAINAASADDSIQYIGIAADEPKRIERHKQRENIRMPLVDIGWSEAYCRQWCEEHDLLSPIYQTGARGGCWFCHNQGVSQLRLLRKTYPELWAKMLQWDSDSPVVFHPDGHTVHDFDKRFELEEQGFITGNFRWDMIKDTAELQYSMFNGEY